MNEHLWKKLGEVKAFASACVHFFDKGRDGFVDADIFSSEEVDQFIEKSREHANRIDEIAKKADAGDIVDTKADATGEKLSDMQGRYLADEEDWKDGMELLEWSGFFFGGAIVHWEVIRGASETIHDADLTALAEGGANFHTQIFETVTESMHQLAKLEAQEQ